MVPFPLNQTKPSGFARLGVIHAKALKRNDAEAYLNIKATLRRWLDDLALEADRKFCHEVYTAAFDQERNSQA